MLMSASAMATAIWWNRIRINHAITNHFFLTDLTNFLLRLSSDKKQNRINLIYHVLFWYNIRSKVFRLSIYPWVVVRSSLGKKRGSPDSVRANEWPIFMANGHLAIHHFQDSIYGEWPWPFTWKTIWFWRMASHYKIRIFLYKEI